MARLAIKYLRIQADWGGELRLVFSIPGIRYPFVDAPLIDGSESRMGLRFDASPISLPVRGNENENPKVS
jgi:hypothetical protein